MPLDHTPIRYPVNQKCKNCAKEFIARRQDVNRGFGIFCSIKCSSTGRRYPESKRPLVKCDRCGVVYRRAKIICQSKSGLNFCSRTCKDLAQRLVENFPSIRPPHFGAADGMYAYRNSCRDRLTNCEACGYDKVPGILVVHHKDRNRRNNSQENLSVLCPNCHQEDHFLARDGAYHR